METKEPLIQVGSFDFFGISFTFCYVNQKKLINPLHKELNGVYTINIKKN